MGARSGRCVLIVKGKLLTASDEWSHYRNVASTSRFTWICSFFFFSIPWCKCPCCASEFVIESFVGCKYVRYWF